MEYNNRTTTTTGLREQEDEYLHKIVIAAATTLAMACLKRVLVMFFVEQWRAKVFLILNVVLLAIFLSSIRGEKQAINGISNNNADVTEKKKKRKECDMSTTVQDDEEINEKSHIRNEEKIGEVLKEEEEIEERLSKEELNERVEAFITMFRKHLVSDARKGTKNNFIYTPTAQADIFNFHKPSNFTNSRHSFCV